VARTQDICNLISCFIKMNMHPSGDGCVQERLHEWLPTVGLGGLVGWHGLSIYLAEPWLDELFGDQK